MPLIIDSTVIYTGEIALTLNAGTGYSWFLETRKSEQVKTNFLRYQFQKNKVGAKGAAIWQITINPYDKKKYYEINFIKKRPWLEEVAEECSIICQKFDNYFVCYNFYF